MNISVLRSMRVGGLTALEQDTMVWGWGREEYQSVIQLDRSNQENHVGVRTLAFCPAPHPAFVYVHFVDIYIFQDP